MTILLLVSEKEHTIAFSSEIDRFVNGTYFMNGFSHV